jgi:hypothetical protein
MPQLPLLMPAGACKLYGVLLLLLLLEVLLPHVLPACCVGIANTAEPATAAAAE